MPYPLINMQGTLSNPNVALEAARLGAPDHLDTGLAARIDARALAQARQSGLAAINVTVGYVAGPQDPRTATLDDIRAWDAFVAAHSDDLLKVACVNDIVKAQASRCVGVIYGFQNSEMFGDRVASVADYAGLGVRIMQLSYNGRNRVADGCAVADDRGLSPFGHQVMAQMQAQRVLVDLSHSSWKTCLDALCAATAPLAITHTACRELANLARNKSDAELRLLAQSGGVVGIYCMPFLREQGQPMASDLVRHIEHAIHVCGEDHVGFGSDGSVVAVDDLDNYLRFLNEDLAQRKQAGIGAAGENEAVALFLPDLCGPTQFAALADLLQRRGHSSARVEKIMGGNFLRLLREVWGG